MFDGLVENVIEGLVKNMGDGSMESTIISSEIDPFINVSSPHFILCNWKYQGIIYMIG